MKKDIFAAIKHFIMKKFITLLLLLLPTVLPAQEDSIKLKIDSLGSENDLDEVVVTGTKIRLVQRGDTLIYDASAFNLPEGSMLDALVRQLPGAVLKSNGEIYVNGRKIDYLTLNGTDFFKGKNKVMLENLPHYAVKNVKVYDKSSERSRLLGREVEKKDFVMDVNLKKEYNIGLLGNMEGGAGTSDRYLARLFELLFTDKNRFSTYGNINNVNEDRAPGDEGYWETSGMTQGLKSTKEAGFDFYHGNGEKLTENLNGGAVWADTNNETKTHSENYLTDGNVIGDSYNSSRVKEFNMWLNNNFSYRQHSSNPFSLRVETSLRLKNSKSYSTQSDSTLQDYWPEQDQTWLLTNRSWRNGYGHEHNLIFYNKVEFDKKLPWGDHIGLNGEFNYNRTKPSDDHTSQQVEYLREDSTNSRDYYADTHTMSYNYKIGINYSKSFLKDWNFNTFANYRQQWKNVYNRFSSAFREQWAEASSFHNSNIERTYNYGMQIYWQNNKTGYQRLDITLEGENVWERMRYEGYSLDTVARRSYFNFKPNISYYGNLPNHVNIYAKYSMETGVPDFAKLMPYENSVNALRRTINNPNLKKTYTHIVYSNVSVRDSIGNNWSFIFVGSVINNFAGQRTIYNQKTGAYTSMQDNINGMWYEKLEVGRTQFLDKPRRLTLEARISETCNRSVDFAIATNDNTSNKNKVNNLDLEGALRLSYQFGKLTTTLDGNVHWVHSSSSQPDYETLKLWDYQYGAILNYTLPWNITIATDIRMYSRRGYSFSEMNTDDLVWNAILSRSFFKGRLTAKLTAIDILHQLSNKENRITPQGHSETWHNSIPRYVIFSLAWKFSKNPK